MFRKEPFLILLPPDFVRSKFVFSRDIFSYLINKFHLGSTYFLPGPKGVGKTHLLYLLTDHLMKRRRVSFRRIVYLDFSLPEVRTEMEQFSQGDPDTRRQDLLKHLAWKWHIATDQGIFLFLDEPSYLKDPIGFLRMFSRTPLFTIVIADSGRILSRSQWELAFGRARTFEVKPLNFTEFLRFREKFDPYGPKTSLEEIITGKFKFAPRKLPAYLYTYRGLFEEFIIWGAYPGVVLMKHKEEKVQALKSLVQITQSDLLREGKIRARGGLEQLIRLLAAGSGKPLNTRALAGSIGLTRPTLERYLINLENYGLIRRLKPFFSKASVEIAKTPQLWLNDTGLRNALCDNQVNHLGFTASSPPPCTRNGAGQVPRGAGFEPLRTRPDHNILVINSLINELAKTKGSTSLLTYWQKKSGAKIDLIITLLGETIPLEVRWNLKDRKPSRAMLSFIRQYRPNYAVVVNNNYFDFINVDSTRVFFLPPWAI